MVLFFEVINIDLLASEVFFGLSSYNTIYFFKVRENKKQHVLAKIPLLKKVSGLSIFWLEHLCPDAPICVWSYFLLSDVSSFISRIHLSCIWAGCMEFHWISKELAIFKWQWIQLGQKLLLSKHKHIVTFLVFLSHLVFIIQMATGFYRSPTQMLVLVF